MVIVCIAYFSEIIEKFYSFIVYMEIIVFLSDYPLEMP